ncbi:MAG: ATP-binding protein [Methanosarcinaceae archaeon]|nr:ATP-binding protein [Methanosarcinaceae archaeon]
MNTKILRELILDQKDRFEREDALENFVPRTALHKVGEYLKLPHILVITGMRRAGKSTLLKQIKKRFYDSETIYYFNFDDERLVNFTVNDFDLLYETFIEVQKKSNVFFFDEIQNIAGWEMFVRRMYDNGFRFIITGSNSSMLSRELGSRLTGRYMSIELFPFSFEEFLCFKNIGCPDVLLTQDRGLIKNAFNEYLSDGGIPEYLMYKNEDLLAILYENILYRDIFARYNLNDESSLLELAHYLFSNYSTEISYNKLRSMLGLGSVNTVKNYLKYMENSYLAFTIPKYDYSIKKQVYSKKKVYVIDNALINAVSFKFSKNRGNILENLVFVELKRRYKDIYFHKGQNECDFLIRKKYDIVEAIQVTTNLKNNRTRDYKGLLEALNKYKLDQGYILTEDEEYEEVIDEKRIIVKPVWRWLLDR